MKSIKIVLLTLSVSALALSLYGAIVWSPAEATGQRKTIDHGGLERAYRIHVPESYDGSQSVPLLLFLHGGGGNADIGSKTGLTPLADKHGFIVVYPEGINKHWNDGRDSVRFREHDATIDDVAFIGALVNSVQTDYKIDVGRIFVSGVSNGGFMSQRLAMEMSDVFSAAGIIIASMGKPLKEKFEPAQPVLMFFMNGTNDPLVPYEGGPIKVELMPRLQRNQPGRGSCISTDEAINLWLKRNHLENVQPLIEQLPDSDKSDDCTAERKLWIDENSPASVVLYRVIGGGHSIPGGIQYLPKRLIGNTCRDFDGLEALWQFFDAHGRQQTPSPTTWGPVME